MDLWCLVTQNWDLYSVALLYEAIIFIVDMLLEYMAAIAYFVTLVENISI